MAWLRENFTGQLAEEHTQEDARRQARGYILQLIGGMMAPDHSGNMVHSCYLRLLEDLTTPRSWGSAALACLYHYLCNAAATPSLASKHTDVGGPFFILQLWAWERLPYLCPQRLAKKDLPPPGHPLGARYVCVLRLRKLHCYSFCAYARW